MILNPQDTIYALSTSLYGGAIAMIRLSGPESHRITQQFFRGRRWNPRNLIPFNLEKSCPGKP
jgi:tRNA U34 5-carboxymethylaminomethyl modifying GTPase MnmE/TrmE